MAQQRSVALRAIAILVMACGGILIVLLLYRGDSSGGGESLHPSEGRFPDELDSGAGNNVEGMSLEGAVAQTERSSDPEAPAEPNNQSGAIRAEDNPHLAAVSLALQSFTEQGTTHSARVLEQAILVATLERRGDLIRLPVQGAVISDFDQPTADERAFSRAYADSVRVYRYRRSEFPDFFELEDQSREGVINAGLLQGLEQRATELLESGGH